MGDGDRGRFELLYAAHYDRVLSYTLCRASLDVARDATSETFLVAWRRLPDVPADPLPWLIGVARRCLADQRRSSGRRAALTTRLRLAADVPEVWDDDPADAAVERDQVAAAMRRLAPVDRELLCLVAWDGLTSAEAAASLGCSRGTLAVRLHRARRRLVIALAEEEAREAEDGHTVHALGPPLVGLGPGAGPSRFTAVPVPGPLSNRPEEAS